MTSPFEIEIEIVAADDDTTPEHLGPHASTTFTTLSASAMVSVYDPAQGGFGFISPLNFLIAEGQLLINGTVPMASPLAGSSEVLVYPAGGGAAQATTVAQIATFTAVAPVITLMSPGSVAANATYVAAGTTTGYAHAPLLTVFVDGAAAAPTSGSPTATGFSFTMPAVAAGGHTLQVKDGNGVASGVASFTVAAAETATVTTPTGVVTIGVPTSIGGTVANGGSLYASVSANGAEGTRVQANVSGSSWTATVTPSVAGTSTIGVYAASAGGAPLARSNSFTVLGGVNAVDGFDAPGIYGPATIYQNSGNGSGYTLGTYFVRGLSGPVTWTMSGFDGSVRLWGNTIAAYGAAYVNPVLPTQTCTLTATDGKQSFTFKVTMVTNANAPTVVQGFVLDTANGGGSGADIGSVGNMINTSYASPDEATTLVNGQICTSSPVAGHYGVHSATLTNNGVAFPVSYWFITETPPVVSIVQSGQPFTNSPVGLVVATATSASDAGTCTYSIASTGNALAVGATGQITVASTLTAGALTGTLTVTSPSGKTTTEPLSYTVGQGTNLPSANMTASLSALLDNSMGTAGTPGPVTVGTVTVTGIADPVWNLSVLNDECQSLTTFGSNAINPRYVITPATNPATATITANYLSAQTDQLAISASQGGTLCTGTFPVTVAAKKGPAVTVTPGASTSASVFPTWNAALDAFWTTPATYQGMTLTLPGGVYGQTATDFSRSTIGHGSNQQWPPGPMVLQGPSPTNRSVLDFAYGARGTGQAGLYAQGGDMVFANLAILHVSNMNEGEGNAGAIYKTGQLAYNCTIQDCLVYTSDMGPMAGDAGNHLVIERCVLAHCGIGAGGLTHNIYAGRYSSMTATDVLSFGTAQVHEFKTRATRGTITNCMFVDGENGAPGASACLDIPDGGQYVVSNTVFHKGPNPNNDNNLVQFCAEIVANGPGWPVNTLELDGCTFINTAAPGSLTSQVVGITLFGNGSGGPSVSPTTGVPASVVVRNCKFYNIPRADWWQALSAGNAITDGGGNTMIYQWPVDLLPVDPSTGNALTLLPSPSYANPVVHSSGGMMVPTGTLQIRLPVAPSVGTAVTTVTGYGADARALTSAVYALVGNDGGNFAINPSTGTITVAKASIPDSLRWVQANVSGKDYAGNTQTYSKYLFIVVGNGTLANAPSITPTSPQNGAGVQPNTAYTVAGTLANFSAAPALSVLVDGLPVTPVSGSQPTAPYAAYSFVMPGLPVGTHTLQIRDNNSGVVSVVQSVTITAAASPVPGTVSGVGVTNVAGASAQIAWTAPASGAVPTGYTVTCTPASGAAVVVRTGSAVTTTAVTGLSAATVYAVVVVASDASGSGPASSPVSFTTATGGMKIVQSGGVFGRMSGNQATISLPKPPTVGNTIILLMSSESFSSPPAIDDTPPAGYVRFDTSTAANASYTVLGAWKKTVASGDPASIVLSGVGPYDTIVAIEVANLVSCEAMAAPGGALPARTNMTSDVSRYLLVSNNGSSSFTSTATGVTVAFVPSNPNNWNGMATLLSLPANLTGAVPVSTAGGNNFNFLSVNLYGS